MKKLFLLIFLLLSTPLLAQFQSDIILTSPDAAWTDARAYSTLNAAIAAAGVNERTILIPSPQIVTTLTVPSNITLEFTRNGSISNSDQLTIQTTKITAPNRQIFTGVGNIDFANGTVIKSGWFSNFESALALTVNDHITLEVTKPQTLTASCSIGTNVAMKWSASGNVITVDTGLTLGNMHQPEAGDYQILAGDGVVDFDDGIVLDTAWFDSLRTLNTWASTSTLTYRISGTTLVDFDTTIPSTIIVDIDSKSGYFDVSAGVTLTINGVISTLSSHRIFSTTGTVVFSNSSMIYPQWWGAVGDGVADDTAAIQAALNTLTAGGTLIFPKSSGCYKSGNISIQNMSGLTILGTGGKVCWTGTAGIGTNIGFQLIGTVANLEIDNLEMYGDGVSANGHSGIWSLSGQTLSDITIKNNFIHDVVIGISLNADLSGTIDGFTIEGNRIVDILGTSAGTGYGIHHANASAVCSNGIIADNYIRGAQRHSIYQARGCGILIKGNTISLHRDGTGAPGSITAAIEVSRSRGVQVEGNVIYKPKDGAIDIYPDLASSMEKTSITVIGNTIIDPIGATMAVNIGALTPVTEGVLEGLIFSENQIYSSSIFIPLVTISSGKHLNFVNNSLYMLGTTSSAAAFEIVGTSEGAGTADYTDDLSFVANRISITNGGGGAGNAFRFGTLASASAIGVQFISNQINTDSNPFSFLAAQTDPNISYFNQSSNTGLDLSLLKSINTGPLLAAKDITINGTGSLADQRYIRVRYTTSSDYATSLGPEGVQFGSDGDNWIVAGNTVAGGYLNFVVNNTALLGDDIQYASHNGILAGTIDTTGHWQLNSLSVTGTTDSAGGSANKAMCWKADGKTLGYCSSVVDATGGCTCN